jgi:hypothetical protein
MKRKVVIIILLFFAMFPHNSCTKQKRVDIDLMDFENRFDIHLPEEYEILFFKSETSIDSVTTYAVLKVMQDYTLIYDEQFISDYAKYEEFNVFDKIQLAKYYFQNLIKETDEKYFVESISSYEWYAYEYTSVTGQYNAVRYNDLYVVHDTTTNYLYIFYDQHQYPYNNQIELT